MHGANRTESKYQGCSLDDEDDWHQFRNGRCAIPSVLLHIIRGHSPSPSPRPPQRSAIFSFTATMPKKGLEKRTVSPHRFPLLRSGSLSSRPKTPNSLPPTTANSSRPTTPNPKARQRYPSEPRKSASMRLPAERENGKEAEQYPSKSKRLLKALLSRRKSKKDDMLYTYLDEY
ncbi:Protein ABIL2 [Morella rubra]|uniref:Protein ABIL2 n=1 Tax=Morella rubra TaxID=262757 RepID=A0A6A1V9M8_9ROSI|nr:Protein ABIL2 [Morella rubra]